MTPIAEADLPRIDTATPNADEVHHQRGLGRHHFRQSQFGGGNETPTPHLFHADGGTAPEGSGLSVESRRGVPAACAELGKWEHLSDSLLGSHHASDRLTERTHSMTHIITTMAMPRRIVTDVDGFLAFLAEKHPDQYDALMTLETTGALADLGLDRKSVV